MLHIFLYPMKSLRNCTLSPETPGFPKMVQFFTLTLLSSWKGLLHTQRNFDHKNVFQKELWVWDCTFFPMSPSNSGLTFTSDIWHISGVVSEPCLCLEVSSPAGTQPMDSHATCGLRHFFQARGHFNRPFILSIHSDCLFLWFLLHFHHYFFFSWELPVIGENNFINSLMYKALILFFPKCLYF